MSGIITTLEVDALGTELRPAVQVIVTLIGQSVGPGALGTVDSSGAFLVDNRLSEIALNPFAQALAQANLGLGHVDPLAYYILAKA